MEAPATQAAAEAVPLCVDLDGTLVKTDTLYEAVLALLRRNLLYLLVLPFWLLRGRAYLKGRIAVLVTLDAGTLPYNEALVVLLREQRASGRRLVLASAADAAIAHRIAAHVDCFHEVIATGGDTNLKGRAKLEALEQRFGRRGFDYVGDSPVDVPIWEGARRGLVAAPSGQILEYPAGLQARTSIARRLRLFARATRVPQWVKNLLLFVPVITAHKLSFPILANAAWAFLAFSLCASANYILNDLMDLTADRLHPVKRLRPFASGNLPLVWGLVLMPLMLVAGMACALQTTTGFLVYLAVYLVCSVLYSARLKRVPLLDVLVLAALYVMRIMAGGQATDLPISQWLLAFSMFLFLSLALAKRHSELGRLRRDNAKPTHGRGYLSEDLELLLSMGTGAGYLSVLILALYVNSPEVRSLYLRPHLLWLMCPVFLYWIGRVWLLAHRGQMDEDPVLFAVKDKVSYFAGLITLAIMAAAL